MRSFVKYFLRGTFVVAPLGLTLYVLYTAVHAVDGLLPLGVPGLGLIVVVLLVALVGYLTSGVIGASAVGLLERVVAKVPLVRLLYRSVQDMVKALAGDRGSFDRPVALTIPGFGRLLGFVTASGLQGLGEHEHVAVYLPQSYNFAGNLVIVPASRVEPLSIPSSELLSFVISGGVSTGVFRPSGGSKGQTARGA